MSRKDFSPTPWTYDDNSLTIEDANGSTVADVWRYEDSTLLRAAPELLAELKDARAAMERSGWGSEDRWRKIDTLIARVEGRHP